MVMTAATLATFEAKTIGRQTLRRGRRTVYVRTYDVPYESSPPLPDAGDFLPGESSGACVTADGVTITPVDNKAFKGLRITVVAQQPVYNDIDADPSTFDLGAYFVEASPSDDGGQSETSVGDSQYNSWRFEVPAASWAGLSDIPDKGDTTPVALGSGGTVLSKTVDRQSVPGFVVCTLVTGWRVVYFDSLTRVSSRLVTIHRKRTRNSSGTLITGPVLTSATTRETQRYVLDDEDEEATYTQITITSIVSSIPAAWLSANRNNRNSDVVTIRGVTFGIGHVLYVSGASEDIQASQSPTGSAALRMTLVLLAGAHAWPLTTDRYIETLTRVKVNVMEGDVKKGDGTATRWVKAAARTDEQTIRTEFAMGAAITALP